MIQIGVRCEIHSCTIEFMRCHLRYYFIEEDVRLIDDAFDARSDAQYYIDLEVADETVERMLRDAPRFLAKCRAIVEGLDEKQVQKIRTALDTARKTD